MERDLGLETKAAAAKHSFVVAAWGALSQRARRELFTCSTGRVPKWAAKWLVSAPIMIEHAQRLRSATSKTGESGRDLRRGIVVLSSRAEQPPPREWLEELSRLDKLPLHWRVSVGDKVAATAVEDYRTTKLAEDNDLLAPASADPLRETKSHFMDRAADHYRARSLRLRHISSVAGFSDSVAAETPQLHTHVRWLIRFQLHGESPAVIAKAAGLHGADQRVTVDKAIKEAAALIGLQLRLVRRGRPPCPVAGIGHTSNKKEKPA